MRSTPPYAVELIKAFEGLHLEPYADPIGLMTIGYGHLIRKGEDFGRITKEQAAELLKNDLQSAEKSVLFLTGVALTDCQFGALVSFVFNLGSGAYQRSTLRQKLNREDYAGAANEFWKWRRAEGKIFKGLVRRRKAEETLFKGDILSSLDIARKSH